MPSTFDRLDRPPLDERALTRALVRPGGVYRDVRVVAATGSTNADLANLGRHGAEPGAVLVAEHQRQGRGRLGRSWQAPERAAVMFSILLQPEGVPNGRWPWLPLLAGVAVAEALAKVASVDAQLKWPNDVLIGGHKVAGILVERIDSAGRPALAVVGMGINVSNSAAELPTPESTSLALQDASTLDRSVLLRAVCRTLESLYVAWYDQRGDPAAGLAHSYRRRCSTLGQQVRIQLPGHGSVTGQAIDVDSSGRLVVASSAAGRVALSAGDVVHVRQPA
jgi:BirA family transcriptional regulator, biotin operon repressor / biotin---[acetyl-CoA-carboxylase] ligase